MSAALLGAVYEEPASPGPPASGRDRGAIRRARGRLRRDVQPPAGTRRQGRRDRRLGAARTPSGSSYGDAARDRQGARGARTARRPADADSAGSRSTSPRRSRATAEIVGATYASSTTFSILTLLSDYRRQLALAGAGVPGRRRSLLAELLGRWLTRPLRELETRGRGARAATTRVRVTPRGPREIRALAEAFNRLAEEIETSSIELHDEERRKSRFVSDVSHELRTPLTAIRGAAETLMDDDVARGGPASASSSTIVASPTGSPASPPTCSHSSASRARPASCRCAAWTCARSPRRAVEALEPLADERGVTVAVAGEAPRCSATATGSSRSWRTSWTTPPA